MISINLLSGQTSVNFNVDECSVMHIGHNNVQGKYNMSNQQLPKINQQRDLGIIITKDLKWRKRTTYREDHQCPYWGLLNAISGTKKKN